MTDTIQTKDISLFSLSDAFDFAADFDTLTIAPAVFVGSSQGEGIVSVHQNNVLVNNGNVESGQGFAIVFAGNDGTIVNNLGGKIYAPFVGIEVEGIGNSETIVNHGLVMSFSGTGAEFFFGVNHAALTNDGEIYGRNVGVGALSQNGGGAISNVGGGLIHSDHDGIEVDTSASLRTLVNNGLHATVSGRDYSVHTDHGAVSLTNLGKVIGKIQCDAPGGNDVIVNHGTIIGPVLLGTGDDLYRGTGGTSGALFGGDGNDRLIGDGHPNRIDGGDGNDTLRGAAGADGFVFDTGLNAATNVDTVTDFTPTQGDRIVLSEAEFAGIGATGHPLGEVRFHIGAHAATPSQRIIYHPANGFLFYDQDGSASLHAPIHFATLGLATHPVIHNTDFIVIA